MSLTAPRFTGERMVPEECRTRDDLLMYLRHLAAYEAAAALLARSGALLEVGSGEGYGASRLATPSRRIVGAEVDLATATRAQSRYGTSDHRFVLVGGGILPFADSRFEGVLSLQVIEHVEDDALFARELVRVAKPGSLIFLTTPNAALRIKHGEKPWNRYHLREYRADELAALLRPHFREVTIRGLSGSPEIQALELARLRKVRRLRRFATPQLRMLLPDRLEERLRAAVRSLVGGDRPTNEERRYSTADFQISEEPESALDLVALCRT